MAEKVFLTKEGYENLRKEYDTLVSVKRKEIAERLEAARAMGDISENAAYDVAREDQGFVEGRIAELEGLLKDVEIVENHGTNTVSVGSKVTVHIEGEEMELHIVGPAEADPSNGRISHESPLGQALIGKKVGEKVPVEAPAGRIVYHILGIK